MNRGAGLTSYTVVVLTEVFADALALVKDEGLHLETIYWHKKDSTVPGTHTCDNDLCTYCCLNVIFLLFCRW